MPVSDTAGGKFGNGNRKLTLCDSRKLTHPLFE